ncbi:MAG: hypothetical protein KKB05_00740, partial [Proteobacteria bacterium]|nr:hypothetical protein [Pseudomonadota bacterium]
MHNQPLRTRYTRNFAAQLGISRGVYGKKLQKEREKIADDVFYNIPPDKERKKMSPRELAKLLSKCEKDSPEYILLEHELNIRI